MDESRSVLVVSLEHHAQEFESLVMPSDNCGAMKSQNARRTPRIARFRHPPGPVGQEWRHDLIQPSLEALAVSRRQDRETDGHEALGRFGGNASPHVFPRWLATRRFEFSDECLYHPA